MDDQNIELEQELDHFLISDQEIRSKLADRNRSPLRLEDLHLDHCLRERGFIGGQPIVEPLAEPELPLEMHSRVEIINHSPYPHPSIVEHDYRGI